MIDVKIGKVFIIEILEKVMKLKMILKKYVGIKVCEFVYCLDYEEILMMVVRYEELIRVKVIYISRLVIYGIVIREGFKVF